MSAFRRNQSVFRLFMSYVLFVAAACAGLSQPYCRVRTFTIDDGLPANNISEFCLSPDGMMWVSTWNGLCYYDGYMFSRFRERFGAGQVLTSNRLKFIRPNSCGDIWCSTYDGKAYLFDCTMCRFVDLDMLAADFAGQRFPVRNILSLSNGYAWVLGNGNINYRIDERQIKNRTGINLVDTRKTPYHAPIRKVMADGRGREWVFAGNGVALYGSNIILPYKFEYMCSAGSSVAFASPDGQFGIYSDRLRMYQLPAQIRKVSGMCCVPGDRLALATDMGVVIFDIRSKTFRLVSVQHPGQPTAGVKSIFADGRGRIWAFPDGPGVSLIYPEAASAKWIRPEMPAWQATTSKAPVFHEDGSGTVWLVPNSGVFSYYDESRGCLVPYNLSADNSNGLPVSYILKYNKDAQNNLWFTGNHNLTLVNFSYYRFKFTPTIPDLDVRSVMQDHKGRIWSGTHNGYVTVAEPGAAVHKFLAPDGSLTETPLRFTDEGVYVMAEDRNGDVWIGTKGRGIYVVSARSGSGVAHYSRNYNDKWSLSCDSIYDFCLDEKGRMWVATYGGGINIAVRRPDGSMSFVNGNNVMTPFKDKAYNRMRRISSAPGGIMVASTFGGIVTMSHRVDDFSSMKYYYTTHIQGDTTSLMASDVLNTYVSRSSGRMYVTTMGGGFQVASSADLLRDNIRFRSVGGIDHDEGIIQSVAEDASGSLWLVRESSIDRLYQNSGEYEIYGSNDWEEDIGFTEAQPEVLANGNEIILGVIGGYLSFKPGSIKKSLYKPVIVFSGVQFQGEQQITPILGKNILDIPAGERNAIIYFSALDYNGNSLIRYAYKIKELDSEWSYTGMSHSVSLNHIPAGRYTLVVRSTNADGVWTDNARELKIYVHPTFWETGWAMLLYVIAGLCVISALLYVWHLRSNIAMEKRLKERQLRFFTGISHQLRTPLTLIDGPVGQVLSEEPLSAKARTYLEFVKKNSVRMLELVNKSLDLKKLDAAADDGGMQSENSDETAVSAGMTQAQHPVCGLDFSSERITVLVVEDNVELRYFLVSSLSSNYDIVEARNGQEGLRLAQERQPDFIITDIMMPVMDGMTMIRKIKASPDTCHIPIVVLSARTAIDYRIEGLNEGIDDYITKPFSMSYLKSRVDNIIRQRSQLQQAYVSKLNAGSDGHLIYKADSPDIADADKDFARQLVDYLEPRISDPELKIDDITRAMALSRSVFYGKVKSLFGMSPIDFVRHMRILRAERLIAESRMSFSEIAYSVGFTDPKYFGRTFKAKTGMTPSDYRKKHSQRS